MCVHDCAHTWLISYGVCRRVCVTILRAHISVCGHVFPHLCFAGAVTLVCVSDMIFAHADHMNSVSSWPTQPDGTDGTDSYVVGASCRQPVHAPLSKHGEAHAQQQASGSGGG